MTTIHISTNLYILYDTGTKDGLSTIYKAFDSHGNLVKIIEYDITYYVDKEIEFMSQLKHRHIASLLDYEKNVTYGDPPKTSHFLVYELPTHGDLCGFNHYLGDKMLMPKDYIKKYMFDILLALEYLHTKKIYLNSISIANIQIYNNFTLKLDKITPTQINFPEYLAPEHYEIIRDKVPNEKTTIWSFGIICYILLTRKKLFNLAMVSCQNYLQFKTHTNDFWEDILTKNFSLDQNDVNFLRSILVIDPTRRFTIEELLQNPYFKSATYINPKEFVKFLSQAKNKCEDLNRVAIYDKLKAKRILQLETALKDFELEEHTTDKTQDIIIPSPSNIIDMKTTLVKPYEWPPISDVPDDKTSFMLYKDSYNTFKTIVWVLDLVFKCESIRFNKQDSKIYADIWYIDKFHNIQIIINYIDTEKYLIIVNSEIAPMGILENITKILKKSCK